MDADGSHRRRITAFGAEPAWSPDGTRIAFEREGGIFVVDPNGRRSRQLTSEGSQPAWSPDGRRIAFVSRRDHPDGDRQDLYVMNDDGTEQRSLDGVGEWDSSPAWSPDGQTIAYGTRTQDFEDNWLFGTVRVQLAVVAVDGGTVWSHRLELPGMVGQDDLEPAWSPDGRWIAVVCESVGERLCAVPSDGTRDALLLPVEGSSSPGWSARRP